MGTSAGGNEMGLKLPPLVKYDDFNSDNEFLDLLYVYFTQDFINSKPIYKENELRLKRYPLREEKEATFYHITTKGDNESTREIDVPRAERIRWIKPIIESNDKILKIWENERKKKQVERSILIFLEKENFLIVIRKRTGFLLFYTSFYVTECYKKSLLREYENYIKN